MIIRADKWQPFLWSGGYGNIRVFAKIFKFTHLKFTVYGCKHANKHMRTYTHILVQCSPASVGLAQAHSNYLTVSELCVLLFTVGGFSETGR